MKYRIEQYLMQNGQRFQIQSLSDGKWSPVMNNANMTTLTFNNMEDAQSALNALTK